MTLIILRAANGHVVAAQLPGQVQAAVRGLPRPITAYHWLQVDPNKQEDPAVLGWELQDTHVLP